MIKNILPNKIVESKSVSNKEKLMESLPMQVGLAYSSLASITNGYIILDFKEEIRGGIRILSSFTSDGQPKQVRIRFGESLSEASSEIGKDGACNDHSPRDFNYSLPQLSDLTLGQTGFRFVRIDFIGENTINIQNIYAVSEYTKNKLIYKYKGNDKEISKIFKVAKHTIDLCSSGEFVWDGVKRDRLVWYGDLHPEMLALATLYGRNKALENSLVLATKEFPLGTWMNNFPTYSMWWLCNISDYYEITKCDDFVKPLLGYAQGLIEQMNKYVSDDGKMSYPFYFVDWPTYQKEEEQIGSRIINVAAVKRAIILFEKFQIDTKAASGLLNKLLKCDFTVKGKQIIGLKYYAFGKITSDEYNILVKNNSEHMSTFMSYYILSAIASFSSDKAIEIMKEYYMGMINLGATTFFEDFDLAYSRECGRIDKKHKKKDFHRTFGDYCYKGYRHSLCHGWSTGVIRFIKENCK